MVPERKVVTWIPPSGLSISQFCVIGGILATAFTDLYVIANLPLTPIRSMIPGLLVLDVFGLAVFLYLVSTDPYIVGLADDAVVFRYHFRSDRVVSWQSIMPPAMMVLWGFSSVFIPSPNSSGTVIDGQWFRLTNLKPNQVVAIVTHPNFRYPLKPNVAKSLGLPPSPTWTDPNT
jgi:hypothetical protein